MNTTITNVLFRCKCERLFAIIDITCPLVVCPFCDGISNQYSYKGEFRNMDLHEITEFL